MFLRGFPHVVFAPDDGAGGGAGAGAGGAAAGGGAAGGAGAGGAGGDGGAGAGAGAGAGGQTVAFAETLPADIRTEAAFRDIKDLDGLARGYFNAQKLIGARPEDIVRLPANPDDKAAWDAVHTRLGRPEKPDGYAFTPPKLPEGLKLDEQLQGAFSTKAHELGLSTKQAAGLYDWWNSTQSQSFTGAETARAAAEETAINGLKTEWGAAYEQNVDLAKRALAHFGGDKLATELVATRQGNNPEVIKVFAKLGATLSEDGLLGKGGSGGEGVPSPAEAKQQINALRADPDFGKAYFDRGHAGHADALAKMARLHEYAYPETPRA